MQFGRFEVEENTSKSSLPGEWTEELTRVLTDTYFQQSEKDNRFFHVYGEIYEKEFVVVISYLHHDDHLMSPISLFLSHDVVEDSKKFKLVLKNLIDLSGLIFDDVFSSSDWNEYVLTWTSNEYRDHEFFYKITRENISLTLQAEEFLAKDGKI
jgi:hypothetical protein